MTKTFNIKTIERFPGTIIQSAGITKEWLNHYLESSSSDSIKPVHGNELYGLFFNEYLLSLTPLSEIPERLDIPHNTASAWADDIIGTIKTDYKNTAKVKTKESNTKTKESDTKAKAGFDIYEYAKQFNADYYDMHTGYIYHIQEYNRAKRLGLPTIGIRVSCDGETIGFASK